MTYDLPQFVRELLSAPPHAGEGVHNWLFRVSRQLHAHLPAGEIVALLENSVRNCGRSVSRPEIMEAVKNSIGCAWQPGRHARVIPSTPKWPKKNYERIEAVCAEGYGLADLWELSPIRIEDSEPHTESIIDRLFPGNPLLCCGYSKSDFDTRTREQWRGGLAQLQLIVPSPMNAVWGKTKNGKPSKHTLEHTGPRRFLVVEFDFKEKNEDGTDSPDAPLIRAVRRYQFDVPDICSAMLIHLAGYAPLVCALWSGGKSMHAWFYVKDEPEDKVLKFFRYACTLGADPATWGRSQFVRMPDGLRDSGKRQAVYFLNFRTLGL